MTKKFNQIAIHNSANSFSIRWIEYCKCNNIPYKLVDCFQSDIIEQLKDCDSLLWHHHHAKFKDVIVAKKILFALEHAGKKVFPDFNTSWHFDDKVAQKYLLEAVNAPLVPSFVFYDQNQAIAWADTTVFPKVFKLKGGAGGANVKLVRSRSEALKLINKAFNKGFPQYDKLESLKERYRKYRLGKGSFIGVIKAVARLIVSTEYGRFKNRERGYIYFQDFIPDNSFDIRIIIVAGKAFAIKRLSRKNDFRASGSGEIIFNKDEIDLRCVKIAFEVNKNLKAMSIAYDFIFDKFNNPLIVEISYGFSMQVYDPCPGYWDIDLQWNECKFNPQDWMVEEILKSKL